MRAITSVALPGVNGTMILTGFDGYACPHAAPLANARQQGVGEHAAHLARYAGEHRHPASALILEPDAGR